MVSGFQHIVRLKPEFKTDVIHSLKSMAYHKANDARQPEERDPDPHNPAHAGIQMFDAASAA